MKLGGWNNFELEQDNVCARITIIHSVPVDDLRPHILWSNCWCNPVEHDPDCWSHNALDGRESYENGRKLQ